MFYVECFFGGRGGGGVYQPMVGRGGGGGLFDQFLWFLRVVSLRGAASVYLGLGTGVV